jgi:threonine/homoserine/homoserine lactone efflux protein
LIYYFLQGVALALPLTITPSPFKIFLISQTLAYGWKRTLPASLVPLVTDGPIIVLVLLLLTQIPAWLVDTLHILGGCLILYLAGRILTLLRADSPAFTATDQAAHQSFIKAVAVNVMNPNPYLLWGVVAGPIVLESWRQSFGLGLSFIAGFYVTVVLGMASLVIVFATVGRLGPRLNKILIALAGLTLLLFGLNQIVVGIDAFANWEP